MDLIREFVKVDSKGRITIPTTLRLALGIKEGMIVMLVADTKKKTITIVPFRTEENQKVVKLTAVIRDKPGALVNMLLKVREMMPDFDATSTNCLSIIRGEIARCEIYATVHSKTLDALNLERFLSSIKELEDVIDISLSVIEQEALESPTMLE